jgi:hypothetical protein
VAIVKLHKELGITSMTEAEEGRAARGRVCKVKSLVTSVERKILEGIARMRGPEARMRVNRAEELLLHAAEGLKADGIDDVTIAGDFRRGCEVIGNLRPRASELGCLLSIKPDVHSIRELELVRGDGRHRPQRRCAEGARARCHEPRAPDPSPEAPPGDQVAPSTLSNTSRKDQHRDNHEQQTEPAAAIVARTIERAPAPAAESPQQRNDENDEE